MTSNVSSEFVKKLDLHLGLDHMDLSYNQESEINMSKFIPEKIENNDNEQIKNEKTELTNNIKFSGKKPMKKNKATVYSSKDKVLGNLLE